MSCNCCEIGRASCRERVFKDVEAEFGFTAEKVAEVAREVAAGTANSTT